MPSKVIKIAISLPKEAFQALERTCEKLGMARSQLITEAVQDWIEDYESKENIHRYIEGYQNQPETEEDLDLILPAAYTTLSASEWSDDETG